MRKAIACLLALAWAAPAHAETREVHTREVTGQYGVLGEWDLVAQVTKRTGDQWTGTAKLRHVGFCTQDGPQEKVGELQLRIDDSKRIQVTLLLDGKSCTFTARYKQGYDGMMRCPDRRPVPMMLAID
ncbi:MAG TPA: hypothetical protein VEC14_00515 [Reyranellaceae bacterium]|nr:hypothetical protein [Reyranellaceae bacterium]